MEKSCKKCGPKASPRSLFYLGIKPKTTIACNKFSLNLRYFERGLSKTFKTLTLFFLLNSVSFNRQSYQKQMRSGTSDLSLFSKFTKIYYILSDQVWWCNTKQFMSYSNMLTNLCKPIHGIINYSTFICPFESGKCGKEEEKLQKFEYLENEKSLLDEIKNIFHSFSRVITWWKNKK